MSKLLKFVWKNNSIDWKIESPVGQGEETTEKNSPEAPMPECEAARKRLINVIASAMELPLHWVGVVKDDGSWEDGSQTVVPYGIIISHTNAGTRSASVMFTKRYRTGKVEKYKTPLLQFDEPSDGETEKVGFAEEERCDLNSMYEHALAYVGGIRQEQNVKGVSHGVLPQDPNQIGLRFNEYAEPAVVEAVEEQAKKKATKKKAAKKDAVPGAE